MATPFAYVAVYVFLEKDGKVLWMRRANTGYRDGYWSLPAGHVEAGESLKQALVREAFEEAGVRLNEDDLTFIHATYRRSDRTYADYFFKANRWEGEAKIMEPQKCDAMEWIAVDTFLENTIDEVRNAWEHYRNGNPLSEITTLGRE